MGPKNLNFIFDIKCVCVCVSKSVFVRVFVIIIFLFCLFVQSESMSLAFFVPFYPNFMFVFLFGLNFHILFDSIMQIHRWDVRTHFAWEWLTFVQQQQSPQSLFELKSMEICLFNHFFFILFILQNSIFFFVFLQFLACHMRIDAQISQNIDERITSVRLSIFSNMMPTHFYYVSKCASHICVLFCLCWYLIQRSQCKLSFNNEWCREQVLVGRGDWRVRKSSRLKTSKLIQSF